MSTPRNQVMGRTRGSAFADYVQVRDDTQSAFMETPARNALLKLSSNASLTWDASAPQDLTDLEIDLELSNLKCERNAICKDLIEIYHRLHNGKGTELYGKFFKAKNKVQTKRKKIHESAKKQKHKGFFKNIGNHISSRTN
jgi:Protein of unknown function (DUF3435)